MSKFSHLELSKETDFDYDDFEHETEPALRASAIAAELLLNAHLSKEELEEISQPSRLTIFKTPDAETAQTLESHWSRPVRVRTRADHSSAKPAAIAELAKNVRTWLSNGEPVVIITPDPERFIAPELIRAANSVHSLGSPNLALVRQLVHRMTDSYPRALRKSDIDGLRLVDVLLSVRPNLSAKECIEHLKRRRVLQSASQEAQRKLADMALTSRVKSWTEATLALMRTVEGGVSPAGTLPYAVLMGPPGTGKTTVAAALAHSAGWEFKATSVGSWFAHNTGHLGDVINAANRFFESLHLSDRPVVALLDELDALPNRTSLDGHDKAWWTSVVTFVLTEVDKLRKAGKPILLLGATNHAEALDPALIRAGRMETRVHFELPTIEDRMAMFRTLLPKTLRDTNIAVLGRLSATATPAQIESWCTAAKAQAMRNGKPLTIRELMDIIAPRSSRGADADWTVALHEAGHAIVAMELGFTVNEISILETTNMGGWVNTSGPNPNTRTREDVEKIVTVLLGGRAADVILGNGANTGALTDIAEANDLLRHAMTEACIYDSLTTLPSIDPWRWNGTTLSDAISNKLNTLAKSASNIIENSAKEVEALAERLIYERVIINPKQRGVEAAEIEMPHA